MRRRLRWNRRESPEELPRIDLTPLLDVVFLVLILFIIVAPLFEREEILLTAGTGESTMGRMDSSDWQATLTAEGMIMRGKQQLTWKEVEVELQALYQKNAHAIPQLIPDRRAPFGSFQTFKHCAERIGFRELDLLLEPEGEVE